MTNSSVTADAIQELVATIGHTRQHLVPLLHAIQNKYHYLPEAALHHLCELTTITPSQLMGVVTFYHQFRLKPAGKHLIKICMGTACHVKGAEKILADFKRYLNISDQEDTDPEQIFTLTQVACLGCCMLAPAIQIDELTYGPVTSQAIGDILFDFFQNYSTPTLSTTNLKPKKPTATVKICLCSSCTASGAAHIHATLKNRITNEKIPVQLKIVGCTGISFQAPLLEIETLEHGHFRYGLVTPDDVDTILATHFKPKTILGQVQHALFTLMAKVLENDDYAPVTRYLSPARETALHSYLAGQRQIATQYSGQLDPLDLVEYQQHRGFEALHNCLQLHSPESILTLLTQSGLRGRGGAGYPTYLKWQAVSQDISDTKYIICNGDEGDPGAFMDRMLMESFPYRILEGMAIAAFACGIKQGYIFLRAEYPLAIERMQAAIHHCEQNNLLAGLELKLIVSAGAFVCGEETALLAAIEGRRGQPQLRPPFPAQQGLWHQPTLINNVETFALVPWILLHQAQAFASLGTKSSPGTKTFALAGKIRQGGLIEVEMGTTLREIIYTIGQGIKDGHTLKAVQIGGPAGGCIPAALIDTPVDYAALKKVHTLMGSGGLIILDEEDCIVDLIKYFMQFTQNESCGKCTFCRIGTKRMLELLEKLTTRQAQSQDLVQLKELAQTVKTSSLCGLGRSAPNPVLSALHYFEAEFIAHSEGRCPAKKCPALITYRITRKCIGCTKCAQNCPANAIEMQPYQQQQITQNLCTKCDICRQVCPQRAIVREDIC